MNPDKYDGGKVTVKDVLVFPLKVVGAIALWIVGVWMMLLGLALTLGIPIVIGIVIYSAVFNGGGNGSDTITVEEDAADSSQDYLGQISPSLERALDVSDEWNRLQEELNQIDLTRLSLSEAENLVEEELAVAQKARTTFADALTVMQTITAPDECLETHVAIIEAFQLAERGFGDIVSGLSQVLRSGSGADAIDRGNRLLAEGDRVKARALPGLETCG